jgi:WD40 repeat protein
MVDHAPSGPDCPAQFNREGCKLLTVKGAQATLFSIEEHDKKEQVKLAHQLIGHNRPITSAVFNAQGTKIATGSHDGSVHLWDVYTGNCTAVFDLNPYIKSTAYSDPILKVAFNSAGTLLAVAANPAILIFDMATQEVICKKLNALQGPCCAMRFIEDNGEFLETIGDDSCARRWDLRGFNRISTLLDTLTPGQAELLVDMYDHGKKTADPYVINECPLTEHWATLHTDIKSLFTDLVASK